MVTTGDDLDETNQRVKTISHKHVTELRLLGMKVNESKSEVVIFTKKGIIKRNVLIAGVEVQSQESMKVLGLTFDANLRWEKHVRIVVAKANSKMSVLKRFRSKYTKEQFLTILTSQFFSSFFYNAPVWLQSTTNKNLWKWINSAHYKAIRVAVRDYKARVNREKLDQLSKRAPPKQWAKYATASIVIKTLRDQKPVRLHNIVRETLYSERRHPTLGKFYNNAKGKIGRQKFGNNLEYMAAIKEEWNGLNLDNAKIRINLKKTFFTYV